MFFLSSKMLSQVSYEQICDNYWYGMYGDFNVILMTDCGFVNATKLCSSGGKEFKDWSRNKTGKELIKALTTKLDGYMVGDNIQQFSDISTLALQNPKAEISASGSLLCKIVKTSNTTSEGRLISGTYIHPFLIPHIACWVSTSFALKVSEIINNFFIDEYKTKLEETRMALDYTQQDLETTQVSRITPTRKPNACL